jgi:DNA polymerase-1
VGLDEYYRGVRRFLDETIAAAREDGFVATYLGRRRHLPDLRSRNRTFSAAGGWRSTPSSGTAADHSRWRWSRSTARSKAPGSRA